MNDLQLHIYQLLQEMDSSEDTPEGVDKAHLAQPAKNDQIEEANVEKSKGKCKEKFLCLSSKPIALGKRSTSAETEIEEKPEIENLLHIIETPEAKERESIKDNKE